MVAVSVAVKYVVQKMFDAGEYFNSLNMFGIRLGLDAVRELANRAGNPQEKLKFIHLAGTNGKGSTGAMLERAFRAAGFRTGFYTSPHLIDIRERFRVDGKVVAAELFTEMTARLRDAAGDGNFSYFEFATVLAMQIFARSKCEVVIWETGMGGRLDATNMVTPAAAVITNIAFDHQGHLGNTLGEIAGEKAGIIKPRVPLFHGKLPDEAAAVIYERAAALQSQVFPPRAEVPELTADDADGQRFTYDGRTVTLALPGMMQRENFRIVYEILCYFAPRWHFDLQTALDGLSQVRWPARFQHIGARLIVDGGHNPDGVTALTAAVRERYGEEKFTVVYAAFGDKDAAECLPQLSRVAKRFVFTNVDVSGRKVFTPEELSAMVNSIPTAAVAEPVAAVETALSFPERVIVSGSLYLAGEVLANFAPESAFDL